MNRILSILAVFVMALMLSASAEAQNRSYVTGYFALDLDGAKAGVIAPIDNKGNATFLNVAPGTHTVALLVPAVQKIREAAARSKASNTPPPSIDIESWSWGVSNQKVVVAGSNSISGGAKAPDKPSTDNFKTVPPKTAPLDKIIKQGGQEYYKIELENILVSSYQSSAGGSSSDRPMESLSLNFSKIEFKYDLKENKK